MTINVKVEDYQKLLTYPTIKPGWARSNVEMGGFGYYNEDKNLIYNIFLVKQNVTSASTDFDPDNIAEMLAQRNDLRKIRVWWHSHADMGCFLSSVDDETIKLLGQSADYIISVVVNSKREYYCQVDLFRPFRHTEKKVELIPYLSIKSSLMEKCRQDVNSLVLKPSIEVVDVSDEETDELFPFHPKRKVQKSSRAVLGTRLSMDDIRHFPEFDSLTPEQRMDALVLYNETNMSWNEALKVVKGVNRR